MNRLLVVLLLAATTLLEAQTASPPPAQGPTFRTGVDVISIDVAAVDAQGRPVEGLLAPEFAVRIDGQPRRVISVQQVKYAAQPAARAARPATTPDAESFFSTNITPPQGRLVVIAVDELNIKPGNVRPLLNVAARFVDNLGPDDQVAFYAYPQPGAFVDFTSDRARIRRAMERVVGSQVPYQGRFNIGLYEAVQVALKQDELMMQRVATRECRRATGAARELCEQEILSDMSRLVGKLRDDRHASLQGLQELLTRLRLVDGPKSLIIVSEGLVLEDRTDLDDTIRIAALAQASVNVLVMDVQRGSDVGTAVMPPTQAEDRELQVDGLREMASASRGALYNVIGNGEAIFARLASELSAYYVLGVEADPRDRDDKAHRIDVEVLRRGVTLRSRRAFVVSPPRDTAPAAKLSEVLFSPFGVPEVPLRATTFAMQDQDPGKVRILIAAEVGQPGAAPGRYTIGWAVIDGEGKVVASGAREEPLNRAGGSDTPLAFTTPIILPPGVYSLRLGVVDASGRRGSVIREVNAWKISGEEFAVGDLVVGAMPEPGQALPPGVEPHVTRDLVALIELYSTNAAVLDDAAVTFEVADDQDSPALVTIRGDVQPGPQATSRMVQGVVNNRQLPPGRYVVRARITRGGRAAGLLARPFILSAPAAAAAATVIQTPPLPIPKFDRAIVMARPVVDELLESVGRRSAALRGALTAARAGQFGAASLEALAAGDQQAAAFLKGLDWLNKGQLDQAATQLNIAAGPRRDFFPAAFYLGAAFAAAGRDRDAAGVWQLAIGTEPRPGLAYALFADARFRDGQAQSVIDVLKPAWDRTPDDDAISQRLAAAYILTERYSDAVPVLDAYLRRHPDDADALFSAIVAQYEATSRAGVTLSDVEREKLARYARAYRGDQRALVDKYLAALSVR